MNAALDGIAVLDVGTPTPGKYRTYLLAEPGADVVSAQWRTSDISMCRFAEVLAAS